VSDGPPDDGSLIDDSRPPSFAHASEAELARILDFYEVRWDYEPHVFPILWNIDGVVLESFAPDFYLPDLDLYVELTTLKQSLVRKKNRKLRRLRELYPDIRIKLFYGRDFRQLMLKYGKVALIDELSGTPGQATGALREEAVLRDEAAVQGASTLDDTSAAMAAPVVTHGAELSASAGERVDVPPPPRDTVRRRAAIAHPSTLGSRTATRREPPAGHRTIKGR
jgi:hypothetical protein